MVSVIIPTWNRALDLQRAIASAQAQTYSSIEILVCDDGSTDNTEELIQKIEDRRVRYIPGAHAGCPAVPRNRGIAACWGEWVAFLDSDDTWLAQKLEVQLTVAKNQNVLAVCTNAFRDYGQLQTERLIAWHKNSLSFSDLLLDNKVICSSMLMRRALFDTTGGFPQAPELRVGEDYSLWLRVSRLTKIAYVDDPLLIYKDDPKSSIRAKGPSITTQRKRVFINFLRWRASQKPVWLAWDSFVIFCMICRRLLVSAYYNSRAVLGNLKKKIS